MSVNIGSTKIERIYIGSTEIDAGYIGDTPVYVRPYTTSSLSSWDKYEEGDNTCAYHYGGSDAAGTHNVTNVISVTVPGYIKELLNHSGVAIQCKIEGKTSAKVISNNYTWFGGKDQGYTVTYMTAVAGSNSNKSSEVNSGTVGVSATGKSTKKVEDQAISCTVNVPANTSAVSLTLTIAATRLDTAQVQMWCCGKFYDLTAKFIVTAPAAIAQS